MASMSGAVSPELPPARSAKSGREGGAELFRGLVVSDPQKVGRRSFSLPASLAGHLVAILMLVLVPLLWPSAPPEHPDYVRALLYNPPPPPPPPLPKGTAMVEKPEPAKTVTPEPEPEDEEKLVVEAPVEEPLRREALPREDEQFGSETGSDMGVPEGMDIGVEGGVVGGVPGGVLGGVVGGTGDGPVLDYDQGPRPIKMTRPIYPQEAFVKKIEGTVELEITIDITGRVVRAEVVRSVPLLDAAAIATVKQWVFSPAIKNGRPVKTVARAPVAFRIF